MGRRVTVRCYAGYKGDERPSSFSADGLTWQVEEVLDRWCDPDHNYFKVRTDKNFTYLLRHDLNSDLWEVIEQQI